MRLTINGFNQFTNFNQLLYFFTKDNKYGNGYKITIDIGYISNVTSRNVDVGAICDIYCKNETTVSFYPRGIVTPTTVIPTPYHYPDIYDIYALI